MEDPNPEPSDWLALDYVLCAAGSELQEKLRAKLEERGLVSEDAILKAAKEELIEWGRWWLREGKRLALEAVAEEMEGQGDLPNATKLLVWCRDRENWARPQVWDSELLNLRAEAFQRRREQAREV